MVNFLLFNLTQTRVQTLQTIEIPMHHLLAPHVLSCNGWRCGGMQGYWFLVGNGSTGQCADVVATSAAAACWDLGWAQHECVVIRVGRAPGGAARPISARRQARHVRDIDRRRQFP